MAGLKKWSKVPWSHEDGIKTEYLRSPFPLLTREQGREYNHPEVLIRIASLMNTYTTEQRKEVTTLDADVPLLRPALIRINVSELRMFNTQADDFRAPHFGWFSAV